MEGLGKIEAAVAGSEAEGLYRLLTEAISYSSMSSAPSSPKKWHHIPTATISKPPSQEPEEVAPEGSVPAVKVVELTLEVPSSTASPALEVTIPAHMTPLHLQLGGIKRVYKCWVEGCSVGPSTSQATICVYVCRDQLGVRLACPSCAKAFLNSDALRHHRKIHSSE